MTYRLRYITLPEKKIPNKEVVLVWFIRDVENSRVWCPRDAWYDIENKQTNANDHSFYEQMHDGHTEKEFTDFLSLYDYLLGLKGLTNFFWESFATTFV